MFIEFFSNLTYDLWSVYRFQHINNAARELLDSCDFACAEARGGKGGSAKHQNRRCQSMLCFP